MIYWIDAWLENTCPTLRILNKQTGEVYMILRKHELTSLQEQGLLDIAALYSADPKVTQEISIELLYNQNYRL